MRWCAPTRRRRSTSPSTSTHCGARCCSRPARWGSVNRRGSSARACRSTRSRWRRPAVTCSTSRWWWTRGRWRLCGRPPTACSASRCFCTPSCGWSRSTRPRGASTSGFSSIRTAAIAVSRRAYRPSNAVIDLKLLRGSPDQVRSALARRGDASITKLLDELEALDIRRRALTGQLDQLKAERNEFAKTDAQLVQQHGNLSSQVVEQRRQHGQRITALEHELRNIESVLDAQMLFVPNLPLPEVVDGATLPRGYVAYTPCFRREAGAAGKDTRGLLRVHQFDKVELVRFSRAAESAVEHERLTGHAEEVLRRLALPYRVVLLAAGDLGFASAKTYDLEVWAPGVGAWLECSSSSTFTDFQARRANIRCRPQPGGKVEFVHTLNASGVALPRTIAALLETHRQPDGSVVLPPALVPYVGTDRLAPAGGG